MTAATKRRARLAAALGATAILATTSLAGASHPRPKGATPLRVPLVTAYNQCTAANRTHGPPLAFPSCNPPAQTSSYLTVGTPDANGAVANSVGHFLIQVQPMTPENIVVTGTISDVRCKPGTAAGVCSSVNATAGPDYSGQLRVEMTARVTDHFNSTAPGGGTDPATVVDQPFPVSAFCQSTADTSTGGVCTFGNTTQCTPPPQCTGVRNGDRTVVGISQIQVFDGGQDGETGTPGNTLFAVQGLFIP